MNTDAWNIATQTIFDRLLDATGHEEGQEAFQHGLPHAVGVWSLDISGGEDDTGFHCADLDALQFNATITGRFTTAEEAREVAMKWLSALPIRGVERCEMFRATGAPSIVRDTIELANTSGAVVVYNVTLPCHAVIDVTDAG